MFEQFRSDVNYKLCLGLGSRSVEIGKRHDEENGTHIRRF